MKFITVAKDKKAMNALDYDTAQPDQVWEYTVSTDEITTLFASGLIDEINRICGSTIDEFESEVISNVDSMSHALLYLISVKNSFSDQHLISELIDLFEKAIINQTAIYFYF